jgi:hypothetical protein
VAAPLGIARLAVGLAVRALPRADDRLRYRAELTAELAVLDSGAQLRYAAGVLTQSLALRAALASAPDRVEQDAMTLTAPDRRSFRCRVLRRHRWAVRSTEDGSRYQACTRCDRERAEWPRGGAEVGLP